VNSHFEFDLWQHNVKFYLLVVLCVQQSEDRKFTHISQDCWRTLTLMLVWLRSPVQLRKEIPKSSTERPQPPRPKKKKTHTHTNVNTKGQSRVDLLFGYKRYRSLWILSHKTVNQSSQNQTTYVKIGIRIAIVFLSHSHVSTELRQYKGFHTFDKESPKFTQLYVTFSVSLLLNITTQHNIQGVPEEMCQTSGGCSLC
jgi:hypothetical protein